MDIATGITLLISCIGLFGLTLFTTARRTREIGICKVMGARVTDILSLLSKDIVVLVLVALVIAGLCLSREHRGGGIPAGRSGLAAGDGVDGRGAIVKSGSGQPDQVIAYRMNFVRAVLASGSKFQ
jgi:hypothetical protein